MSSGVCSVGGTDSPRSGSPFVDIASSASDVRSASPAPSSTTQGNASSSPSAHENPGDKIAYFWDIENCAVPREQSAFEIIRRLRGFLQRPGMREVTFKGFCDVKQLPDRISQELDHANVKMMHVPRTGKSNSADFRILDALQEFTESTPPPATVVCITGDIDYIVFLNRLRFQKGYRVIIVHSTQAKAELTSSGSESYAWSMFASPSSTSTTPVQATGGVATTPNLPSPTVRTRSMAMSVMLPSSNSAKSLNSPRGTNKPSSPSVANAIAYAAAKARAAVDYDPSSPRWCVPTTATEDDTEVRAVYLTGINGAATKEEADEALLALFGQFGVVEQVAVPMDKKTRRPRGYAFVTFTDPAQARASISGLNGATLFGHRLKVRLNTMMNQMQDDESGPAIIPQMGSFTIADFAPELAQSSPTVAAGIRKTSSFRMISSAATTEDTSPLKRTSSFRGANNCVAAPLPPNTFHPVLQKSMSFTTGQQSSSPSSPVPFLEEEGFDVFVSGIDAASAAMPLYWQKALTDLSSTRGQVLRVTVPPDKRTGRCRGFAFVRMSSHSDAERVRDILDGAQVLGSILQARISSSGSATPAAAFDTNENNTPSIPAPPTIQTGDEEGNCKEDGTGIIAKFVLTNLPEDMERRELVTLIREEMSLRCPPSIAKVKFVAVPIRKSSNLPTGRCIATFELEPTATENGVLQSLQGMVLHGRPVYAELRTPATAGSFADFEAECNSFSSVSSAFTAVNANPLIGSGNLYFCCEVCQSRFSCADALHQHRTSKRHFAPAPIPPMPTNMAAVATPTTTTTTAATMNPWPQLHQLHQQQQQQQQQQQPITKAPQQHPCAVCGLPFPSGTRLQAHIKERHPTLVQPQVITANQTSVVMIRCPECRLLFESMQQAREHAENQHVRVCRVCLALCVSQRDRDTHECSAHLECRECYELFDDLPSATEHMDRNGSTHTTRWLCEPCGTMRPNEHALLMHNHAAACPTRFCLACPGVQLFPSEGALAMHLRETGHAVKGSARCSACAIDFATSDDLISHYYTTPHFTCVACKAPACSRGALVRHHRTCEKAREQMMGQCIPSGQAPNMAANTTATAG